MIEVYKNLFVGNQYDYEKNKENMRDFAVIHACKEPYHRMAVGYTTKAAPKNEYYYFLYDNNDDLILNIIDDVPAKFYSDDMIDEAINFAVNNLSNGKKVLIHCNQGESRAPSIAMLVLKKIGFLQDDFQKSYEKFMYIYPNFNPAKGILEYVISKWHN